MTVQTAEVIIRFLDQYNTHFEKLANFLLEKQNHILKDDLTWLEDALVDEQSYIMKGNSLEDKRLALFEQAGIKGVKLVDMAELFPEDYIPAFNLQSQRLNNSIAKIKRINEISNDLVERKIKVQSKLLGVNELTGIGAYSGDAHFVKGSSGSGGDIIGNV
ncbi:MAG: flagellar protein FlgN [Ruminococcaceae bacterium]|nr:flagellar protein FlgN [Oscillospiraceae bacterium]